MASLDWEQEIALVLDENERLKRRTERQTAIIRLLVVLLKLSGFRRDEQRLADGAAKAKVLRHSDQEHEHVHVGVTKIHPTTLKMHHPWKDIEKFQALATERELGLHRVHRSRDKERTARSYASRQFESARGEQSFARWARKEIGETLELDRIADWQELHAGVAARGVRLVPRGNGLALVDATRESLHCKASALGRHWSKQKLVERFGAFQRGPSAERVARAQRERYELKPLEPLRDDGLWHEYQRERIAMRLKRTETRESIAARIKRARDAHRSRFKLRHHAIQALPIAANDKRTLYKALRVEREAAERTLQLNVKAWRAVAQTPKGRTWKTFLAERAAHGDPRAFVDWNGNVARQRSRSGRGKPTRYPAPIRPQVEGPEFTTLVVGPEFANPQACLNWSAIPAPTRLRGSSVLQRRSFKGVAYGRSEVKSSERNSNNSFVHTAFGWSARGSASASERNAGPASVDKFRIPAQD